jgi:hypothetical protein
MQLNAFFPSLDIGSDPAKIRDWAQAAEELGYAYIEVPDHVFGATARDGWVPLYNEKAPFHETFVMLGFLAAVTKTIRLSSGILIAPQRQTGLIAKHDARRASSRTSQGAAPSVDGEPRELQRALPRSQRRQHRAAAGTTADPDLVWRLVRRRGAARRPARRRLDADHGG